MWERCQEFHGHTCKGLAIGYRVGTLALDKLAAERAADEEIVAIVENASCAVDAISVVTGATLGKGNLFLRDYGKQVYTFGLRSAKKAIRISPKTLDWPKDLSVDELLAMPEEQFAQVTEVVWESPPKARIYPSFRCSFCGESTSEGRLRVRDGQICCIPCAQEEPVRWDRTRGQ
ncbi:MAG TPA: formylmethanofuran dehydrogenase [Firmicutes bacterium]|mgnify:CR=1 FL=1|nr:formylmethanofuran dehydrogenase [Bacillota bacterium]